MKQGTATRAFQGRVDPEYDGEPMVEMKSLPIRDHGLAT